MRSIAVVGLIILILIFSCGCYSAEALQQVAGKIEITLTPGETSTFLWGLLSDTETETELQLRAAGDGSEFMSLPTAITLKPGELYWVSVSLSIPNEHPGSVELQPSLSATELGQRSGATIINIQMQKQVKLRILANPNLTITKESMTSMGQYPQLIKVGDNVIELLLQSSSTITDFRFDEGSRTMSFNVSGTGPSTTIIAVDSVLEGPYSVSIDGEVSSKHESILSDDAKESIKINHDQSEHEITISGTSVVPEFSVPLVIMALALAAVACDRLRILIKN
jgi:hypothetical protein